MTALPVSISCIPVSPMAYRVGPNELIPAPAAPAALIASRRPGTSRGWKESSIFLKPERLDGIDRSAKHVEILFGDAGKHPHQHLVAERPAPLRAGPGSRSGRSPAPASRSPLPGAPGSQAGCASPEGNRDASGPAAAARLLTRRTAQSRSSRSPARTGGRHQR